ncbi:MAG: HEPN domain-containing protein [Planctomycetota bacterium]
MKNNKLRISEWFKQSEYDFATAGAMFKSRRYIYAVFMCHLAMEKALKGLYCATVIGRLPVKLQPTIPGSNFTNCRSKEHPPKIHDLVSLVTKCRLNPSPGLKEFVGQVNQMSIVTRYPESLAKMQKVFSFKMASKIIKQTKEALKWIKEESDKLC